MQIARVIGDLTATQKHSSHEGQKLLLVQPLTLEGEPKGNPVVAVDAVNAGVGDRVLLVMDGYAAMTSVDRPQTPIDMSVIGVIDEVELAEKPATPSPQSSTPRASAAKRGRQPRNA